MSIKFEKIITFKETLFYCYNTLLAKMLFVANNKHKIYIKGLQKLIELKLLVRPIRYFLRKWKYSGTKDDCTDLEFLEFLCYNLFQLTYISITVYQSVASREILLFYYNVEVSPNKGLTLAAITHWNTLDILKQQIDVGPIITKQRWCEQNISVL